MAEIEIMPLGERLSDEEIVELTKAITELGSPKLPEGADDNSTTVADGIDDDVLTEFLDRLEAHDIACEIYLPVEFDGRCEVAQMRVGSAPQLVEVLEEMKDELFTDDEDAEEDEEAEELDDVEEEAAILEGKLRVVWKLLYAGAKAAIERNLPLHVQS